MQAIILSRRAFREFDQIVSLFTSGQGKVDLLARGVKKITSKNSAHLEPFSLVDIEIAHGKEINHLTKVHPVEYFVGIRKSPKKILSAAYIMLLVDQLSRTEEKQEQLFFHLLHWLDYLNEVEGIGKYLLTGAVVNVLACLGFSPGVDCCVVCGVEDSLSGLYYQGGGMVCVNCEKEKAGYGEEIDGMECSELDYLRILLKGNLDEINSLSSADGGDLQNLIHKFLVYHAEKGIPDWKYLEHI